MSYTNIELINAFFSAYAKRDIEAVNQVMDENAVWFFPGHHAFSGKKQGIKAIIAFFDTMGSIMGPSDVRVEKFFMEQNNNYVLEYQHIQTNRKDNNNLSHYWCVAWQFKNGKIVEGRHLAGDQHEVDRFFHKISQSGIAIP
ncbi:MAG: nuclear transport factor 2 family protein [Agriterribacter sp.]